MFYFLLCGEIQISKNAEQLYEKVKKQLEKSEKSIFRTFYNITRVRF